MYLAPKSCSLKASGSATAAMWPLVEAVTARAYALPLEPAPITRKPGPFGES